MCQPIATASIWNDSDEKMRVHQNRWNAGCFGKLKDSEPLGSVDMSVGSLQGWPDGASGLDCRQVVTGTSFCMRPELAVTFFMPPVRPTRFARHGWAARFFCRVGKERQLYANGSKWIASPVGHAKLACSEARFRLSAIRIFTKCADMQLQHPARSHPANATVILDEIIFCVTQRFMACV